MLHNSTSVPSETVAHVLGFLLIDGEGINVTGTFKKTATRRTFVYMHEIVMPDDFKLIQYNPNLSTPLFVMNKGEILHFDFTLAKKSGECHSKYESVRNCFVRDETLIVNPLHNIDAAPVVQCAINELIDDVTALIEKIDNIVFA